MWGVLYNELTKLADTVARFREAIQGEQHTKNVLIEPVLRLLGFEITNPFDIITEFSADFGVKKGEKVDYALLKDKEVAILLEAKDWKIKLEQKQISQLFRYFSVSTSRLGILSNGIEYMFFTDTKQPNTMDMEPFFKFNLLEFNKSDIEILSKFHKDSLNIDSIRSFAKTVSVKTDIKNFLLQQATNPTDDFIALLMRNIDFDMVSEGLAYKYIREGMKTVLEENIKVVSEEERALSEVAPTKLDESKRVFKNKLSGIVTLADFNNVNATGTKPKELFFVDIKFFAKTWADVLTSAVKYALDATDENFVLYLDESFDGNKGWIKKSMDGMQTPKEIGNSGIYVDTCASAIAHINRLRTICRRMEITESDVLIELK